MKILLTDSRKKSVLSIFLFLFLTGGMAMTDQAQNQQPYRTQRNESREQWLRDGQEAVIRAKRLRSRVYRAKNVILFVGDGMGVATVTAARILEGQQRGSSGEENLLSFERLPYAFRRSKRHPRRSHNGQISPDS